MKAFYSKFIIIRIHLLFARFACLIPLKNGSQRQRQQNSQFLNAGSQKVF